MPRLPVAFTVATHDTRCQCAIFVNQISGEDDVAELFSDRNCGTPGKRPRLAGAGAAAGPTATTKVTDNVYIFRYIGHQSMFIVTPEGVIATDPISLRRPAKPYIDAIQAVTKAPIKYVIYSHSHFDHIAGGQPFKDLGATFVAQRNAKERILELEAAGRCHSGPSG